MSCEVRKRILRTLRAQEAAGTGRDQIQEGAPAGMTPEEYPGYETMNTAAGPTLAPCGRASKKRKYRKRLHVGEQSQEAAPKTQSQPEPAKVIESQYDLGGISVSLPVRCKKKKKPIKGSCSRAPSADPGELLSTSVLDMVQAWTTVVKETHMAKKG